MQRAFSMPVDIFTDRSAWKNAKADVTMSETMTDERSEMVNIWFAFRTLPFASSAAPRTLPPMLHIIVSTLTAFTNGITTFTALKASVPRTWLAKSPSTSVATKGAMAVSTVLTAVVI